MKSIRFIAAIFCLLGANLVFAQSEMGAESRFNVSRWSSGWEPSFRVAYGYLDQTGIADADGQGVGFEVLGTYNFKDTYWLGDAGIGFQKQYLQDYGKNPALGVLSLGARYEFPYHWSAGPIAVAYFGDGVPFGRSNDFMPMVGASVMREFNSATRNPIRVGLKYVYELGNVDQTTTFVGLTFEWTTKGLGYAVNPKKVLTASLE